MEKELINFRALVATVFNTEPSILGANAKWEKDGVITVKDELSVYPDGKVESVYGNFDVGMFSEKPNFVYEYVRNCLCMMPFVVEAERILENGRTVKD